MSVVPLQVRALGLVNRLLPAGMERAFILRWLEPRAKKAAEREEKRKRIRESPAAFALAKRRSQKSSALDKADTAFSIFIRTRDSKPISDGYRVGACCTCGRGFRVGGLYGLQCGHWILREFWGTRFEEMNSHGQCNGCNNKMHGNGKEPEHRAYIIRRHGEAVIASLEAKRDAEPRRKTEEELNAIAELFNSRTKTLLQIERNANHVQ